ncbi:MAG: fibronectin type III domain-containing protein, partial [Spirochaetales bacterium]|nr:fibronectin type III domain-containing protein [Spirochaetales bacterium]
MPTTTRAVSPVAPAAPSLTPGTGQITVTWTAVDKATSYEVWWNTVNDTATAAQYGSDCVLTVTVINGVPDGFTYWVWIKAKNRFGTSGFSPAASVAMGVPTVPPSAPNAPTLTPADSALVVSWGAVAGASAYEVWYNTVDVSASATQFGGDITILGTTITGLTNGTTYYVWVLAKNAIGSSPFSPSSNAVPQIGPPAAPGAPVLTPGDTQIDANWGAVGGATQYRVYINTINDTATATPFGAPVIGTNVTITGLTNGTLYYVWVRAENAGGLSGYSPSASATPQVSPPAAPGAPVLTPGDTVIDASWGAVATATQYRVYRNTINDSATATQFGAPVGATNVTITGLTNGTLYYVWVRAENAGGLSGYSPSASATPVAGPPAAPGAPVLAAGPTVNDMGVSWGAVAGANLYRVYYNTINDSGTATEFGAGFAGTSATITGLSMGTEYYVWVRAENAGGQSGFSLGSSQWTLPDPPATVTLTPGPSSTEMGVSWSLATGGVTGYLVYYNTVDNSGTATQFGGPVGGLSTTITGLTPGTLYYVWVRSRNFGGDGPYSASSNATTIPAVPAAPGLTPGDTTIDVTWVAVAGATQYHVYYYTADIPASSIEFGAGYAGTSATITGLTNGTLYYVWVRAENSGGLSGYSPSSNTTPVSGPPAAPGAPVLTAGPTETEMGVSWGAVATATLYRVYYNTIDDSGTATEFGSGFAGTSTTIT